MYADPVARTGTHPRSGRAAGGPLLAARMLGPVEVALNDTVVDTASSRRTRQVLAYLLVHRRPGVSGEVLMDVFWPDAGPGAARNNLHVALNGVRRALRAAWPGQVLQRRRGSYAPAGVPVWLDTEEFAAHCADGRRAERAGDTAGAVRSFEIATQLYEGDFLADDLYSGWTAPVREALRADVTDARCRLIDLYVAQGDLGPAVALCRRVLAGDPCNEVVHRRLMTCHARSGQVHLALAQYRRCADALWESFRIVPAARTTALYDDLRRTRGSGLRPR